MAIDTATIRVKRQTRDLLAKQAQERGVSVAAMLSQIAQTQETERIWESERAASRADSLNPEVACEDSLWETTLGDGVA